MTNIICAIGFGGDASGRNKIGEIVVTVVDESFNATKTPLLRYAFPVIASKPNSALGATFYQSLQNLLSGLATYPDLHVFYHDDSLFLQKPSDHAVYRRELMSRLQGIPGARLMNLCDMAVAAAFHRPEFLPIAKDSAGRWDMRLEALTAQRDDVPSEASPALAAAERVRKLGAVLCKLRAGFRGPWPKMLENARSQDLLKNTEPLSTLMAYIKIVDGCPKISLATMVCPPISPGTKAVLFDPRWKLANYVQQDPHKLAGLLNTCPFSVINTAAQPILLPYHMVPPELLEIDEIRARGLVEWQMASMRLSPTFRNNVAAALAVYEGGPLAIKTSAVKALPSQEKIIPANGAKIIYGPWKQRLTA